MRKFITSFMILVLLGLFSGSLFAGKVEVCEAIKHDPAYKGLYGLCNAYWNADEADRPRILELFLKKLGPDGPEVPWPVDEEPPQGDETPPPECPCWTAEQIAADLGMPDQYIGPTDCWVEAEYMWASYSFGLVDFEIGDDGPHSCSYYNGVTVTDKSFSTVSPDEATEAQLDVCVQQLSARIVDDFNGCPL